MTTPTPQGQHSPTPWTLVPTNHGMAAVKVADNPAASPLFFMNQIKHIKRAEADAAFIVRAANHYELMVSLLRRINAEKGGASAKLKGEIEEAFNSMGEVL